MIRLLSHRWLRRILWAALAGTASLALPWQVHAAPPTEGQASGVRRLASDHLQLFTDLHHDAEVDALPALFDQAFLQWCAYFDVDPQAHRDWTVRAWLMKSRDHFQSAAELPAFAAGYSRGAELWLLEQPSAYYRRHLLFHEGTHAFMEALVGGKGPPWLAEGIAELLATHALEDDRLSLNVIPTDRDQVPKWGRIEMVQAAVVDRRAMTLQQIVGYDARASLENQSYAWCWAAAVFFDHQKQYQSRFRELARAAGTADFPRRFSDAFADDWPAINREWQLYAANLDYGYDFQRNAVERTAGSALPPNGAKVNVAADRSWQSSGVRVEAGKKYLLSASGRYQVAHDPRPWWCEPAGVTIRYYRGQPLGILLAAIVADDEDPNADFTGLLEPFVVGLGTTIVAPRKGTLYFRINDSSGSLSDNAGALAVEITNP
jgi:hypothetical protein